MTTLAPVSVALKFGFLVVLYLFLLWVARSARRDLRVGGPVAADRISPAAIPPELVAVTHDSSVWLTSAEVGVYVFEVAALI